MITDGCALALFLSGPSWSDAAAAVLEAEVSAPESGAVNVGMPMETPEP